MVEQPKSRVYLFNRIFFNGEGKIFNKLGNVSRKKPARFTDGNRAKYYFHKLARYGGSFFTWLVRIYSTTVAGNRGKVLGRRENEGRLLVPEMGSAFSPDHRKIWCFEAYTYACVYIYIHIYVSQCQPRNVYSAYEFQFASTPPPPLGVTRSYTQWNPLLRLILLSCAENVARTACESWHLPQLRDTCFLESTEFVITLEVEKFE